MDSYLLGVFRIIICSYVVYILPSELKFNYQPSSPFPFSTGVLKTELRSYVIAIELNSSPIDIQSCIMPIAILAHRDTICGCCSAILYCRTYIHCPTTFLISAYLLYHCRVCTLRGVCHRFHRASLYQGNQEWPFQFSLFLLPVLLSRLCCAPTWRLSGQRAQIS